MPTRLQSADFRILVGAERVQPYSMSLFNISAMSFGSLSAAKVTPEIAETRGVPLGQDCVSPAAHSAFWARSRSDSFDLAAPA